MRQFYSDRRTSSPHPQKTAPEAQPDREAEIDTKAKPMQHPIPERVEERREREVELHLHGVEWNIK